MNKVLMVVLAMLLGGCLGMPKTVQPVNNFELGRYLGTWYEIARLDHSFERGLTRIQAEYSLRDDGGVRVLRKLLRKCWTPLNKPPASAGLIPNS